MTLNRRRRPRSNLSHKIHVGSKFTTKSQSSKASSSYQTEESRSDIVTPCHLYREDEKREGPLQEEIKEHDDSVFAGQERLSKRRSRRHGSVHRCQQETEQNRTSTTKIVNALAMGAILTIFAITRDVFVLRFLSLIVIGNVAALCWHWVQFFRNSPSFSTLAGINQTVKQIVLYQYNKTVEGGVLRRKMELVVIGFYHEFLVWFYHWWYYSE